MVKKADQYDRQEAEALLIRMARAFPQNARTQSDAAQELVDAFLKLNTFAGLQVVHHSGNARSTVRLDISMGGKAASLTYSPTSGFFVGPQPVPLRYNVFEESFEGSEEDSYYAPEPGQPRRHRAALAELVGAVFSAFGISPP